MNGTILLTHTDLDGMGNLILGRLFQKKLGIDDFLSVDYGFEEKPEILERLLSYDKVIITDLSPSETFFKKLKEKCTEVRGYDHHETSSYFSAYEGCVYDSSRCGTKIFWEEYVKNIVKRYPSMLKDFIDRVNTYDMWKENSPLWEDAVGLNSVLYAMKNYQIRDNEVASNDVFVTLTLRKIAESGRDDWFWTERESRLIQIGKEKEERAYQKAKEEMQIRVDQKDRNFGIIKLSTKISLVCSRILREKSGLDYIICINTFGGITGKLSIRTRDDKFNLNDLAMAHGHPASAGAVISPEKAIEFWDNEEMLPIYKDDPRYTENNSDSWFEIRDWCPF